MVVWFFVYILMCMFVGAMGKNQPIGFLGYTLLALFLSPITGLVILLVLSLYAKAANKKVEKDVDFDSVERQS